MSNYNKRLDELMPCDCKFLKGFAWRKGDPCEGCINGRLKQAILDWHDKQVEEAMAKFHLKKGVKYDVKASGSVIVITHTNKLKERDDDQL